MGEAGSETIKLTIRESRGSVSDKVGKDEGWLVAKFFSLGFEKAIKIRERRMVVDGLVVFD